MMEDWQFVEIINTLRDYQTLLNQISVLLITAAGILIFKNHGLQKSKCSLLLSSLALIFGIISLVMGFLFRSQLIDIIPGLEFPINPSSLTDPQLKCLSLGQLILLICSTVTLAIGAFSTPRSAR